jgi:hypothetical protein
MPKHRKRNSLELTKSERIENIKKASKLPKIKKRLWIKKCKHNNTQTLGKYVVIIALNYYLILQILLFIHYVFNRTKI